MFASTHNYDSKDTLHCTPSISAYCQDESGDFAPPTTSDIITPRAPGLDAATPIFSTKMNKEVFFASLPNNIKLMVDQPFGKDNLNQCFYLQKTGKQALFLILTSGYLTNTAKKKLERAFPPARQLSQIMRKYQEVDFRTLQGFQAGWEKQKELPLAQRDMATACLLHFKLSLPAMVRWIGGPHVAAHRDNKTIFERIKKTCKDADYQQLVRIFTHGSPTYINAECLQPNYEASRKYGNHSSINNNPAMVHKTLNKQVARGAAIMLDPSLFDFCENMKQTPQGILGIDHLYKKPRVVCDSSHRPEPWCESINDWTNKQNEPGLEFAQSFEQTLIWIWNLRITYPKNEIYVCDDDASNAFKQVKYPPNLAGLHCYVVDGTLYAETEQTFGDCTSPSNWEPIALCRSQHAQALWNRADTVE
jgi:hypothetical protein